MSAHGGWIGGVLVVCACAAPPRPMPRSPPPPPPVVEPAPPVPAAWQPSIDPAEVAKLARLDECSERHIERFRESESPEDLLAALECFEGAGRAAQAIQVIRHATREFPERVESEDFDYRQRLHYRVIAHELLGADTLVGRVCGASAFDPPPKAEAEAISSIATCLEEAAMLGAALRYWRLVVERPDGSDYRHIETLEEKVRRVEERILER